MGFVEHQDVQITESRHPTTGNTPRRALFMDEFRTFLRDINSRFQILARTINTNRREGLSPTIPYTTTRGNVSEMIWIADEEWEFDYMQAISTVNGGTATMEIDGVAFTDPLPLTTAVQLFTVTGTHTHIFAGEVLGIVTTGLGGLQDVCITVNFRRVN